MIRPIALSTICSLAFALGAAAQPIRVACMGDSITYGAGITQTGTSPATWEGDKYLENGPRLLDQDSYPEILQTLLGDGYDVRNFGASGRTVTGPAPGLFPYRNSVRDGNTPSGGYTAGVNFAPDVILLMLGTNDTKVDLWATSQPRFEEDYKALVEALQNLPSNPYVVICYPIPIEDSPKPNPASGITESNRQTLLPIINKVIAETGAGFINTNPGMPAFSGLLSDQVHPNQAGAAKLAEIIDAGFPAISIDPTTGAKTFLGTRPQVSISAPADRSVVVGSDAITVTASAFPETITGNGIGTGAPSATVLPITRVEFFINGTKFGEATTAPFSAPLSNLAPDTYTITARATNSAGLTRDSRPITLFASAQALPAGGIPFARDYKESFNSLVREVKAATLPWTNDQTLPGWYGASLVSATWTAASAYQGDDGGSNTAVLKSLGASWARDRSLGTIAFSNRTVWGVCLLNATTSAISQITVQYTGEQWRTTVTSANNRPLTLEFSTTATTLASSTGFTAASSLTFQPPVTTSATTTKLDGKLPGNRRTFQQTLTIPGGWQPGSRLWLRWSTGPTQSATVGIDDVTITAGGGSPLSPAIVMEGSQFRITWTGIAGSTYQIETSSTLGAGSWSPMGAPVTAAGNGRVSVSSPVPEALLSMERRFFRIRITQ